MPITAVIATVSGLSMAGIPLFNGFLSKEMMLEEAAHTVWAGSHLAVPIAAGFGALLSVAYSFRFIAHVFLGPERDDYPSHPHDPPFGMWAGPAFLAILVVIIGIQPALIAGPLVAVASGAVIGGELPYYSLKIWHGFTPALYISAVAVIGGAAALYFHRPLARIWNDAPRPEAKVIFEGLVEACAAIARRLSETLHNGAISRYLAIFAASTVALGYLAWRGAEMAAPTRELLPVPPVVAAGWVLLLVATLSIVLMHHRRFRALVLIGVVGLMVSAGFVYLSAPDLALTQISVETVTIMLLLLALHFLPKETPKESPISLKLRDGAIAAVCGLGVGALAFAFLDLAIPPG